MDLLQRLTYSELVHRFIYDITIPESHGESCTVSALEAVHDLYFQVFQVFPQFYQNH